MIMNKATARSVLVSLCAIAYGATAFAWSRQASKVVNANVKNESGQVQFSGGPLDGYGCPSWQHQCFISA